MELTVRECLVPVSLDEVYSLKLGFCAPCKEELSI